jgi:Ca2+-binding RTX toxin-like protein
MKKGLLISLLLLAALPAPLANAEGAVNLLLTGSSEDNGIQISLSSDGRDYVIDSSAPLEVGGDLCTHPGGDSTELLCEAPAIAGFEVNVGAGADVVVLAPEVPVPATLRGGPGHDRLIGGSAADKLLGGSGDDVLGGRHGNDVIFGGPGDDRLYGGAGDDVLRGGPGTDTINGGWGQNELAP